MKVAIFFDTPNFTGGIFHQTLNTINLLKDKDFLDISFEIVTTSKINIKNFEDFEKPIKIFSSHNFAERFNRLIKSKLIKEIFKNLKSTIRLKNLSKKMIMI